MLDYADYFAASFRQQHKLQIMQIRNPSICPESSRSLKGDTDHTDHTDHIDHTDHTDHTDHLSEV